MKQKNGKCQNRSTSSLRDIHLHSSSSTLSQEQKSIWGAVPIAPHAAPLTTSPTRSSAHEPAWVYGLSSPWPSAVLGLLSASSLCRLHRLSMSRSNVSSEQKMASRISSSVVNKMVSPKCSGADRGPGRRKSQLIAHPNDEQIGNPNPSISGLGKSQPANRS